MAKEGSTAYVLLVFFGVSLTDHAIGMIGGVTDDTQVNHHMHVVAMWVKPQYRGCNVAAELIKALKNHAHMRGYQALCLSVAATQTRPLAFYLKQEFQLTEKDQSGLLQMQYKL